MLIRRAYQGARKPKYFGIECSQRGCWHDPPNHQTGSARAGAGGQGASDCRRHTGRNAKPCGAEADMATMVS